MIVVCPNCGAGFRVDPARLPPQGRRVRCSACGYRWILRLEAEAEARVGSVGSSPSPTSPAEPTPSGATPAVEPPPLATAPSMGSPSSGKPAAIAGWLVVLLLLLALAAAVVGRNEIVSAFPQTAALYERLGLPVTARLGLEFKNLTSKRIEESGIEIYVVEGEIHNLSAFRRSVPSVRVALLDTERNELGAALSRPQHSELEPGGITRFEARLADPPPNAKTFRVSFAP